MILSDTVRYRFSAELRRYILYVRHSIQMQFVPPDQHSNGVSFLLSICLELLCLHCLPRLVEPDHLFQSLHNLNTCREISATLGIIEIKWEKFSIGEKIILKVAALLTSIFISRKKIIKNMSLFFISTM